MVVKLLVAAFEFLHQVGEVVLLNFGEPEDPPFLTRFVDGPDAAAVSANGLDLLDVARALRARLIVRHRRLSIEWPLTLRPSWSSSVPG